MKKLIPIFVCVILFSACQQTKQGIVKDLLDAENSFEKEKVNQLLSDSFYVLWTCNAQQRCLFIKSGLFKVY